ncbi:META domain-containing protein [Stappia sp. MMSF_3263]|uniref:META domain-containing protein n=1 Tax=Stappia sp. MMSF_3263 TaxID=3046693 RepID=UPI00273D372F|nr:META domain-containing protein [Stappia sp. MMSF_3263]
MTTIARKPLACLAAAIALALSAATGSAGAQQEPSITGTWRIAALAAPGGALVDLDGTLAGRTEVTVDRHGLWLASAGCNRLRGTLEQDGQDLAVSEEVMATKMACQGPAGDLERRFMHFFPAAVRVDGMPDRVLLRDRSGAAVVLLVGK